MIRLLAFLLFFATATATASAQPIPLPQSIGPPAVAVGLDASGHLIPHIVTIGDIATPNPQTTSTTSLFFGGPQIQFALDNPAGFVTGSILFVQVPGLSDNFAYCVATNIDAFGFTTCNITFLQGGMAVYNNFVITLVNGYTTNSVPPWAGQGVDGSTSVSVPTPGTSVSLTIDAGKVFQYSSGAYCYAFNDPQNTWFAGFVTSYNSSSGAISVVTQFVSPTASVQTGFTCSLAPLAQNNASLNNWASDNLTIPSSTPSQLHFTTVVASQYFPIQGQVLITCTTNTANQMTGQVVAYSGTSMYVNITSVLAGGGTNCSAWAFYLTTGPTTRISLYQMNGLQMSGVGSNAVAVNAGSVRDSSDTIDLFYVGGTIKIDGTDSAKFPSVAQTGTIADNGATLITGSGGTTFTTAFSTSGTLTDLNSQLTALNLATLSFPTILQDTTTSQVAATTTITNDASMNINGDFCVCSGHSYARGGSGGVSGQVVFGVYLAYHTADGVVSLLGTSFTRSGAPDLPAGYSFYRILGYVLVNGSARVQIIGQPLANNVMISPGDMLYFGKNTFYSISYPSYLQRLAIGSQYNVLTADSNPLPTWGQVALNQSAAVSGQLGTTNGGTGKNNGVGNAGQFLVSDGSNGYAPSSLGPKAVFSATITPTALGINETSCNTSTGRVQMASNHGLTSGQSVVLTGTVSSGYTTGQAYYVNAPTTDQFTTWTNYADAVAGSGASQVKCSVNNNAGWSLRYFAYTNVFSIGFSGIAPIGGTPSSTSMAFDFNFTNALASTVGAVNIALGNLVDSSGAQRTNWVCSPPYTFTSTTLVQSPNAQCRNTSTNAVGGTWAQEGTTAWTMSIWINGALDDPIPANDNDLIIRAVA